MPLPASLAAALATALAATTPWPGPLDQPATPHVIAITDVTRDQDGAAIVATGAGTLDARLNANIAFSKDSATLTAKGQARLTEIASGTKALPAGILAITGYTDDLGSSEHGLALSRRRAAAVAAALAPALPPTVTATVAGKGESDPLVPNTNEAARAQNRRVQVTFTPATAP